eukprot:2368420-Prymnesium_polylepis.1
MQQPAPLIDWSTWKGELAFPLLEVPAASAAATPAPAWEVEGGERFDAALAQGAVRLIDAHFIVSLAHSGAPMPSRRELPEEAFITVDD